MRPLERAWVIFRRELGSYFHAPIAYVVGVAFLVLQGLSFWAVVSVLSDPRQRAPLGAVLEQHFGGTILFWATLILVVAAISMRLVAEDRRQGTWEALLTTPVGEAEVLVGKWLAAVAFYGLLWLPTALYLVVLATYSAPEVSFDPGPVLSSYLGVLLLGAGFLAIGLAASAATTNQIIAAVVTFVVLLVLLVVGQLDDIAAGWLADHPGVARVAGALDIRAHMGGFARGAIALPSVVVALALATVGLALAAVFTAAGRLPARITQGRAIAAGLIALIVSLTSVLLARHPVVWDVSRAQVNTLAPRTEEVLASVPARLDVLVIQGSGEVFEPVHEQAERVLDRLVRAQPLLERRTLDPALEPARAEALAREFAIALPDLVEGGAVVFGLGERRRIVDLLDMASFDRDSLGVGTVSSLRAEEAFARAIAAVIDQTPVAVCATSGHGELPFELQGEPGPAEASDGARTWAPLAERLSRDGMVVRDVGRVDGGVPASCRVLVVFGPTRALAPSEAAAMDAHLAAGGALLLALAVEVDAGGVRLPPTGLELVLAARDIATPPAVVIDPVGEAGLPGAWVTSSGYGAHPVTSAFRGRRLTVWHLPRVVRAVGPRATELVRSSVRGWGESDPAAVLGDAAAGPGDVLGPVAIAAAASDPDTGARLVAFGSAASLSAEHQDLGAGTLLAHTAVAWLAGRTQERLDIGAKTPETIRLIMTDAERNAVFVACVVVVPLVFGLLGAALWWWRRRE